VNIFLLREEIFIPCITQHLGVTFYAADLKSMNLFVTSDTSDLQSFLYILDHARLGWPQNMSGLSGPLADRSFPYCPIGAVSEVDDGIWECIVDAHSESQRYDFTERSRSVRISGSLKVCFELISGAKTVFNNINGECELAQLQNGFLR
jgi:hypothetical protein